jgi:hypothetical protein
MRISLELRLYSTKLTLYSLDKTRTEPLTLVGKTRLLVWEPEYREETILVFLTPLVLLLLT